MIHAIQISNFQAHKSTYIAFNEGVNAIIGISDSGKTSILRALTWCITNKPSGDAFQSSWGGDTIVTVTLSSGDTITRGRDKKGNYYKVNDTEFRAFGAGDPPQEVQALFNMNNINISAQMDAPFLLSSSPGEVAQILNRVVNLDVIDTATSNIRKKKLEVDRELSAAETRTNELSKQLTEYAYLEELEKDIIVFETLQNRLKTTQAEKTLLHELITQWKGILQGQQAWYGVLKAEPELTNSITLWDMLRKASSDCDALLTLYNQGVKLQKEIAQAGKILDAEKDIKEATENLLDYEDAQKEKTGLSRLYRQIRVTQDDLKIYLNIEKAESPVMDALTLTKEYEQSRLLCASLKSLIQSIQRVKKEQGTVQADLTYLEEQFHELMPENCPLCGQEIQ